MRYLITGACGYLGGVVADLLAKHGEKVRCLAMKGEDISHLPREAEVFYGDICDVDALAPAFVSAEKLVVIHAAGIVTVERKITQQIRRVNVEGTDNVVALCEKYGADLVYVGSVDALKAEAGSVWEDADFDSEAVYGAYAKTKAQASCKVIASAKRGNRAMVVMPTAIFGPYDYKRGMVMRMLGLYTKQFPLPIIRGGYDFVDVRDVAMGIIAAAKSGRAGESYIFSGEFVELKSLVDGVRAQKALPVIHIVVPNCIAKAVGGLLEMAARLLKKPPLFTAYTITCINSGVRYSCKKAREKLGYVSRPFAQTVSDTLAFMREQGWF